MAKIIVASNGTEVLSVSGHSHVALLLNICNSQSGRQALAEKSGLSAALLLKWTRLLDKHALGAGRYVELLRISDVAATKIAHSRNAKYALTKTTVSNVGLK